MKRFHFLLFALSGIMFLLSINRLTSFTSGYVISNEFLRWSDFNALIIISLITVFIFYLLIRNIVSGPIIKSVWWINILLLTGVYLFGAGTGVHEVTNYLNSRFCTHSIINEKICSIIR